jgi:integrase
LQPLALSPQANHARSYTNAALTSPVAGKYFHFLIINIRESNMPSKVLNEQFIKTGLVCPENKHHIEYTSDDRSGLYVEVRSTSQGQGTYWFRFKEKDTGKTARVKIGRTTDISIREAKEQVKTLRARIQLGADLAGESRKKKESLTWSEFFDQLYLPHSRQHKRSWANDEEMHRLRIKARFGHLQLNKITRHAVQQFHNELQESGLSPATCDHHLKLIRQALNLAVDWDLLEANPVSKIKLFNIDNREERLMSDEDLQRLIAVLDNDRNRTAALAVKFLLLSSLRVSEALQARWSDLSPDRHTLTLPASNKSKRRRAVPLSDAAIAVLDQLGTEGNSEWLFVSNRSGNRLTTINKAWQRIRQEADLPQTRLHDLRHQAASHMLNSGYSLYVVQQVLGHSDPSVTQRYAHLSTETLQGAANSVGTYLEKALENSGK